jgi:hypothetical protein
MSYGPPWAHYLSGYQDRLLGGPLGLPDLCHTVPIGVRRKDYGGEVLGGNLHCIAYLNSLPFQEGTPLAPAGENTRQRWQPVTPALALLIGKSS